jgi:hypothetical protein
MQNRDFRGSDFLSDSSASSSKLSNPSSVADGACFDGLVGDWLKPSSNIVLKEQWDEFPTFPAREEDGGTNGLNSSDVNNRRVELLADPWAGVESSCSVAASYEGGR